MTTTTMTRLIICLSFIFSCMGCGSDKKTGNDETAKDSTVTAQKKPARSGKDPRTIGGDKSEYQLAIDRANASLKNTDHPVLGYWVGSFGPNMINITLSFISGSTIEGFSVCAGNYRPIKGTIEMKEGQPSKVVMNEPGDDKYDGKFEFEIDSDKNTLRGKWTPFMQRGNQAKTYVLNKREFEYNPKAGEYALTSTEVLKEEDVENIAADVLQLMRNEIYARHGYSFKDKEMRRYFEAQNWYMPMGVDIRDQLTDVEVENIDLIYRYEEYYEANYDSYGR